MAKTSIEWTEHVWNPIRGCSRVSEGCRHCYAERVAARFSGPGQPYQGLIASGGQWNGKIMYAPDRYDDPLRWRKPRRVFVNSMSDLFHESVEWDALDELFGIMAVARRHTFQVLTKRPTVMHEYMGREHRQDRVWHKAARIPGSDRLHWRWPLPNVWLGVSVEDQATADERIPLLLQTPAAVRWVSAEPLLGPVPYLLRCPTCEGSGSVRVPGGGRACADCWSGSRGGTGWRQPGLDWVVAGGESGPGARPAHPDWFRSLRDQCQAAGVPFFMKQLSGERGRAIKDIERFPEDLQIREYPHANA